MPKNLKKITNFFLIIPLILAFSCAYQNYNKLLSQEENLKRKGGYDSYLALEYLDFSRRLLLVEDYDLSEHFAEKGLNISAGAEFIPENPIAWNADIAQMEELVLMQKRLENVVTKPSLRFQLPIQLAHLSYLYDCWVTKESKAIFRSDELAKCRVNFSKLIDEIETYESNLSKEKIVKFQARDPEFVRVGIMFDPASARVADESLKPLFRTIKYISSIRDNYLIFLAGNGDSAVDNITNRNLARSRVENIKNYLIRRGGVSENLIKIKALNENFPDVITTDSSSQFSYNRSVGIYIIRGQGNLDSYSLPTLQNSLYREQIKEALKERGLK